MSAVYGVVNLAGGSTPEGLRDNFKNYYKDFKIDRLEDQETLNAFFGCGIQYFNDEAKREALPLYDEANGNLFTADCVLDNREELCGLLSIAGDTPDGRVLYESYFKWGLKLFDYVRGVFSFALYDVKKNRLILAADHFAQRCLHYHRRGDMVFFSTLFFPIIKNTGLEFKENERWILDCLANKSPSMISEPRETPMLDVFKVVSGTYVVIDLNSKEPAETRYFDPDKLYKTDWSITLQQSEQMARDTMTSVIKKILRPNVNIGTQLSQGLDSSTVACIAARELAKEGKTIRSYTSVPDKDAGLRTGGHLVYDETEGVMKIVKAYPNIIPTFLDTKGHSYLKEVDDINNIWELPSKSHQNSVWTTEIAKVAGNDGCKILLDGATGNCTISAGYTEYTFHYYLTHFHFYKAYHTLDLIKRIGVSRKLYVKNISKSVAAYYKKCLTHRQMDVYQDTLINRPLADEYRVKERLDKLFYSRFPIATMKEMRRQMYMPDANAQIGEIDTKFSLNYGVLYRDPMRTVDVIKMCFSLPVYCYASSDFDRRLVRVGMKGIVPAEIREDISHRGRQSGDNNYRLMRDWDEMLPTVKESMYSPDIIRYFSTEEMDKWFNMINASNIPDHYNEIFNLINTYSLARYLKMLKKQP